MVTARPLTESERRRRQRLSGFLNEDELREWENLIRGISEKGPAPPPPLEEAPVYEFPEMPEIEPPAVTPRQLEQPVFEPPEVPSIDRTAEAERRGMSPTQFVSEEHLEDLARTLRGEEPRVQWQIPYEQYLTAEQAKFVGFDVPEGSLVLMTPMAEGESQFFIVSEQRREAPERDEPLELALRDVFPEMFDPARSWGYSPEDLPGMAVEEIKRRMATDYPGFFAELYDRVGATGAEFILKKLGVPEDNIMVNLPLVEQEAKMTGAIQGIFPDIESLETFQGLLDTDFDLFIETIQTGNSSTEKRRLLGLLGYDPYQINEMLSRQRLVLDIDGIRQSVIVDIETQAAYDQRGNFVGRYNPTTREFTAAPQESIIKDAFDWTWFQSRTMWEMGENFFLSVMPELVFRDMTPLERAIQGDAWADETNRKNRQLREDFRFEYAKNKDQYNEWVRHHPELLAPVDYQEGAGQHPELLRDPRYYVYELANIMPFIITATAMTIATGGVGLAAAVGTAALMVPIESQGVYEDLIRAGAPEDKAAGIALIAGTIIGSLESAGRIPILKQVSPFIFGQFKKRAISELSKKGLAAVIKKFGRNFTINEASEVFTEVAQEIVSNVAVSVYDENRGILDNLSDIAIKTGVATLLPAGLGAGASVRMIGRTEQTGLTDLAKKAKGWIQDEKGNWYASLAKEEAGFALLPGKGESLATQLKVKLAELRAAEAAVIPTRESSAQAQREVAGLIENVQKQPETIEGIEVFALTEIEEKWENMSDKIKANLDALGEVQRIRDEYSALYKQVKAEAVPPPVEVARPEPGMPEAGIQPAMIEGVPAREVRPKAKAEIVQISMDDQLKLDQARKAVEEAPPEAVEAYEAQEEITSLEVFHEADPVAQFRFKMGNKWVGLDSLVSIRQQSFPDHLTVKQAQALNPEVDYSRYLQKDTSDYNKVPLDALDIIAERLGFTGTRNYEALIDRVMAIRQEKARIKVAKAEIKTQMTEKPLPAVSERTTEEVTENWQTIGQPKLTLKQAKALSLVMSEYILSEDVVSAFEAQRALWSRTRTQKGEDFKARMQELIVSQGVSIEEAYNQAKADTLAGELPRVRTDFLEGIAAEMREAFFTLVYQNKQLQKYPYEMASTMTALTNALSGNPIPRIKGTGTILFPEGGSAWDRLNFVFGEQPEVIKAIEKMAKEKKPVEKVVEGIFHETGREPIPLDQEMVDYLNKLSGIPFGYKTLFEPPFDYPRVRDLRSPQNLAWAKMEQELGSLFADGTLTLDEYQLERMQARDTIWPPQQPPPLDPPVKNAFQQPPMFNFMEQSTLNRVLKEIAWSPLDIGNFMRANKASFDNSYLRQSKMLASGHPVVGWQGHTTAWQSMFSQRHTEAEWELITRDVDFQIYEQIRIDTGADPLRVPAFAAVKGTERYRTAEEFGFPTVERLIPKLTQKLPHVKYSERAFSAGTNKIVWGVWKQKLEWARKYSEKIGSGEVTLKEGEAFDIIREMTEEQAMLGDLIQRANLQRFSGLAPAMNAFFFAARSKIGRFLLPKHLLGITFTKGKIGFNPRIMTEAWRNFVLWNGYIGGLMFLGNWLGLWDLEDDPRNAEFMSARIGKTRIDPWAGYRQFVVLYARIVSKTGISSVTGAEYDVNPPGAVWNFIKNSLSPLASILLEFWTGRNFLGQVIDYDDAKYWIEKVTPFAINDVWEAYEGEGWKGAAIATIPAVYGEGVQTYTGDWEDNWTKLGLPKHLDNTGEGLFDPKYDVADFWGDTAHQFKDIDIATLTAAKGFPDYIRAIAEARIIKEHLSTLPSKKPVNINDALAEGKTIDDLRQLWVERQKLINAGDEAEYTIKGELQPDGKRKDVTYKGDKAVAAFDTKEITWVAEITKQATAAVLGNMSQRQYSLLMEYHSITDTKKQKEFLEKHKDEIGINRRDEYLRTHTSENAQLAVWGQAKILTKEAYNEFKSLIKSLDIPDNAIPELTLPPGTSLDTHFTYEEMVSEGTHTSVETDLLLLKDQIAAEEAGVQSYAEWRTESGQRLTVSSKSDEYLQLRVDNQQLFDDLEAAGELPTKAEQKAERERVRATVVGDQTFHDIERRVDVMNKGTREVPIPEDMVNAYVVHMRMGDDTSPNSSEVKLNRYDTPGLNEFLMDEDVWGDQKAEPLDESKEYLDNYLVPRWRIDVEYRAEDEEYDAIKDPNEVRQRELRDAYLVGEGLEGADLQRRNEYRLAKRKHQGLELSNPDTGERIPVDMVDSYVDFNEIPQKGKRQERFVVGNPRFAEAMFAVTGQDIWKTRPEDVPSVEFDNIYDEWREDFDMLEAFKDADSPDYKDNTIEDENGLTERERARDAVTFTEATQTYSDVKVKNKQYTAFGLARIKRDASEKFVPEEYINDYVAYYKIYGEGKPPDWELQSGTKLWHEDDWFMMEHLEFYRKIWGPEGILGNEKWDFTKVPTREVFDKYLDYIALPHQKAMDDFRWINRDLDAWGVIAFDWTSITEKKRREKLTPQERFIEGWAERGEKIEEKLKALRE